METTGVFFVVLLMLFLLGVTPTAGISSGAAFSLTGDGVLMRDTEKRPCTVGVKVSGLTGVFPGVAWPGVLGCLLD